MIFAIGPEGGIPRSLSTGLTPSPARFSISDEKALHMRLHSLRVLVPRGDLSYKVSTIDAPSVPSASVFVKWLQYSFFRVFRYIFSTSLLLHETRRVFFVTKQDCEVRFMIWHKIR